MYRQDWEALSKHVAYKTSLKQIWNLELGSRRREPRACAGTSCAQVLISRGPSLQRFFSEHTEPSQGKLNINAYLTMRASVGTLPLGLTAQAHSHAHGPARAPARAPARTPASKCARGPARTPTRGPTRGPARRRVRPWRLPGCSPPGTEPRGPGGGRKPGLLPRRCPSTFGRLQIDCFE